MPESELDKQLKQAQIDKYGAEREKAIAEKNKVNFGVDQEKRFWKSLKFWIQLITVVGVIFGFFQFFIPNVITPIAEHKVYVLLDSVDAEKKNLKSEKAMLDTERSNNNELKANRQDLIHNMSLMKTQYDKLKDSVSELKKYKQQVSNDISTEKKELAKYKKATDSLEVNSHVDEFFFRRVPMRVDVTFSYQNAPVMIANRIPINCYATTKDKFPRRPYVIKGRVMSGYDIAFSLVQEEFYITLDSKEYKIANGKFYVNFQGSVSLDTTIVIPVIPR
jgi:hypothetical protein